MSRRSALLLVLSASLLASAAATGHGDGGPAYSDANQSSAGSNACGFGELSDKWEKYYAALPAHIFNREEHCGKCIRLRGADACASGDWVVVLVVDSCLTCEDDWDIDLSKPALKASAGFSWDRKTIEWEWTPCAGAPGPHRNGGRRKMLM